VRKATSAPSKQGPSSQGSGQGPALQQRSAGTRASSQKSATQVKSQDSGQGKSSLHLSVDSALRPGKDDQSGGAKRSRMGTSEMANGEPNDPYYLTSRWLLDRFAMRYSVLAGEGMKTICPDIYNKYIKPLVPQAWLEKAPTIRDIDEDDDEEMQQSILLELHAGLEREKDKYELLAPDDNVEKVLSSRLGLILRAVARARKLKASTGEPEILEMEWRVIWDALIYGILSSSEVVVRLERTIKVPKNGLAENNQAFKDALVEAIHSAAEELRVFNNYRPGKPIGHPHVDGGSASDIWKTFTWRRLPREAVRTHSERVVMP